MRNVCCQTRVGPLYSTLVVGMLVLLIGCKENTPGGGTNPSKPADDFAANGKIVICHYPIGNPNNFHEIEVSESAMPPHLAHGDSVGPCPSDPPEALPPIDSIVDEPDDRVGILDPEYYNPPLDGPTPINEETPLEIAPNDSNADAAIPQLNPSAEYPQELTETPMLEESPNQPNQPPLENEVAPTQIEPEFCDGPNANLTGLFANGSGSAADPYLICTITQLNNIRGRRTSAFKLMRDLNLAGYIWRPLYLDEVNFNGTFSPPNTWVGTYSFVTSHPSQSEVPFTGRFDGNRKTIRNYRFTTVEEWKVGLFGYLGPGSQVVNLNLKDVYVSGTNSVGALASLVDRGIVNGVSVSGTIITTGQTAGGLIGFLSDGQITRSYSSASVTAKYFAGGLIGASSTNSTVAYSYSKPFAMTSGLGKGGLVGNHGGSLQNSYSDGANIVGCNNNGKIDSSFSIVNSGLTFSAGDSYPSASLFDPLFLPNHNWVNGPWVVIDGPRPYLPEFSWTKESAYP